jgi:hypothetical protein
VSFVYGLKTVFSITRFVHALPLRHPKRSIEGSNTNSLITISTWRHASTRGFRDRRMRPSAPERSRGWQECAASSTMPAPR